MQDARAHDSLSGNQFTMAPERLTSGLCEKSDVFSFGILFGSVIMQCVRVVRREPHKPMLSSAVREVRTHSGGLRGLQHHLVHHLCP